MLQPKRLFDCIQYQLEKHPKKDMLNAKVDGVWKAYSTEEVRDIVDKLSAGFIQSGISAGNFSEESSDKIAIISGNRPEWLFVDMAVQQAGAILVPIYPTTHPNELQFILNDAQVKMIFASSDELYDKVQSISSYVPSLKKIYTFDEIKNAEHWTSLTALANNESLQKANDIKASVPETHVSTIIYTSGTTGTPKGVMLTHKNILSNLMAGRESFPFPDVPQYKALSFLPLNHIFEKNVTYIYLFSCISIYYAESINTIAPNLQEVKPDMFTTVPRLLEKVFETIMNKGEQLTGIKRKLFFWAVSLGEKYDNNISGGFLYNMQLALANKIIFSKWRDALGGNVKCIITGGAACPEKILRIFNAAKILVYEGYGPTENSPVVCVNQQPPGICMYGTVGPPINNVEVKLADDGEILVKGPSVMKGYYKRPDLTAETIKDGWLYTGDIGIWVGKALKITDRKKELFKTSGGKYVAPQPLENKLRESPFIAQVMVVGAERKFVGALIVPAFGFLQTWMKQQQIASQGSEADIRNPKVLAMYKDIVEKTNESFNHVEQIKKFELLPQEWSVDTGELTPKMSMKRKIIMEKFKVAIERIYD